MGMRIYCVIVMCVRSCPQYVAEHLYKSMKGVGTDDETVVRVIVSRSEVLIIIKNIYIYPGFDIKLHFYMNLIDYDKSILTY